MAWDPNTNYAAGYSDGQRSAQTVGGSAGISLFEKLKGQKREAEVKDDILFLKKRLAATRAVRDTLRDALKEVAPDHPLLAPESDQLKEVGRSAADQITSPADKI